MNMKKYFSLVSVFVLAMVFIIPGINAKEVKTIDLKEETSGVVTVSGTTEADMLAVAIIAYDKDNNLAAMKTSGVVSDKYSDTIELKAGTYTIKVADYDGGEYKESKINVTGNVGVKNPNTLDDIYLYIILGVVAVIGIIYYVVTSKKTKK